MLVAADFNGFLSSIGDRAEWRRSFACPCGSGPSGAADKACPSCSGKGRLWQEPVECVVGRTGSNVVKRWAQFGQYDEGDSVLVIGSDSPAYAIAAFDRLLMLDQSEPFSLKVVPGVTRIGFAVLEVEQVLVIGADRKVANWSLPDIDQSGNLTWPQGAPPAAFSMTGRRPIEYFAWTNQPFDRPHQGGESLPRRVVVRRFDLFGRSS